MVQTGTQIGLNFRWQAMFTDLYFKYSYTIINAKIKHQQNCLKGIEFSIDKNNNFILHLSKYKSL